MRAALCLIMAMSLHAQERIHTPDKLLYAIQGSGRKIGKGEERERFTVYTSAGRRISVLHIWLTTPDGDMRVGVRGCESYGWIDNRRFFCEGSYNPSTGVYLWFDARSGKELGEAIGTGFTWSPDRTKLARFGNVPHFTPEEFKSDSLEVDERVWQPEYTEQHWFCSDLSWSPDSRYVAVVDHQRRERKGFYLLIMDTATGAVSEHRLKWRHETDGWPPEHDFNVRWRKEDLVVQRGADTERVKR